MGAALGKIAEQFFETRLLYSLLPLPVKAAHLVFQALGHRRTVAQPGSAFAWGAKGHEFKSRPSDQFASSRIESVKTSPKSALSLIRECDLPLTGLLHSARHAVLV